MTEPSHSERGPWGPAPALAPERRGGREVDLLAALSFASRNAPLILIGAVVCAAIALAVVLSRPATYQATATLVVVPPRVASELKPEALSVHGYQRLLESDAAVDTARRRLVDAGVLEPQDELKVGSQLRTRIFVSRRQDTNSLAPLVELIASARSPEVAAQVANTWATVFLELTRQLVSGATDSMIEVVEEQHPVTNQELEAQEAVRLEVLASSRERVDKAGASWDARIARQKNNTAARISEYQAETRQLMESELGGVSTSDDALAGDLQRLLSIRTQLAQRSPVRVLEKAMSDESVWQSLLLPNAGGTDVGAAGEHTLVTQEIDPVHDELTLEAAALEAEVRGRGGRELAQLAAALASRQNERSTGLAQLQEERSLELVLLRRRRAQELEQIDEELAAALAPVQRSIHQLGALHQELVKNLNQAVLARAQEDIKTVYLAAPAVPLAKGESRGTLPVAAVAALIGGLLGLGAAVARDALANGRRANLEPGSERDERQS